MITVKDFGAVGDGSTDDTTALQSAYASAAAAKEPLYFPTGTYKFTSTLTWDGRVDVYGAGKESTILKKLGNFVGIEIVGNGGSRIYADFKLDSFGSPDADVGIQIGDRTGGGTLITFRDIYVYNQGSHGIRIVVGYKGYYENIYCTLNTGDGIKVDGYTVDASNTVNANQFNNLAMTQNTGCGLHIVGGDKNVFLNVVAEQNTAGGIYVEGISAHHATGNLIDCYCELNSGPDIKIAATNAVSTCLIVHQTDTPEDTEDNGTNTQIIDLCHYNAIQTPSIGVPRPGTNIAGRTLTINGGKAGSGGTARGGGAVFIDGGEGVAGGARGTVSIQSSGGNVGIGQTAPPTLLTLAQDGELSWANSDGTNQRVTLMGSSANYFSISLLGSEKLRVDSSGNVGIGTTSPAASAKLDLVSTSQGFLPPRMTTTEKNAISAPAAGLTVFDTTVNKLFVYDGSAWIACW